MESFIGNLNHNEHVIPTEQYFLTIIYNFLNREIKGGPQRLLDWNIQDFQIWIKFLKWLTPKWVPIKNIVFNVPAVTLQNTSQKHGIGVYIERGLAWHWNIPP